MDEKFNTVVLGGTFDHLHKGHKEFIRFALSLSEKVIIGLTSDRYIEKISNLKSQISNLELYEERKTTLEKFLNEEEVGDRVQIIKIDDIYGPAISEEYNFNAIVVVEKTLEGAKKISEKRKNLGLSSLEIVIAPSARAEDGKMISSSRIRAGEINREGKLCINPLWLKKNLLLPDGLRVELKKPLGELIIDDNLESVGSPLIAVGDVTVQRFNKLGVNQKISIIDFNVARKKKFNSISELGFSGTEEVIKVKNPAGQITAELFLAVIKAFSKDKRVIIQVLGEEDLAVLPAILAAPLSSFVFYGQPEKGIVKVKITEEIKEKAYSLLSQFNTRGY